MSCPISMKYTVNQGYLSLSTYYLEYGRHVARLRRRRAYASTSNTASHDNHEKINSWVSFSFLYGYGAPLGFRAAGAPLWTDETRPIGKQHNKNGTNRRNNSGDNWEYLYYGKSKGNFCNSQHYKDEWVSKGSYLNRPFSKMAAENSNKSKLCKVTVDIGTKAESYVLLIYSVIYLCDLNNIDFCNM